MSNSTRVPSFAPYGKSYDNVGAELGSELDIRVELRRGGEAGACCQHNTIIVRNTEMDKSHRVKREYVLQPMMYLPVVDESAACISL
jgi:hypothetical protein